MTGLELLISVQLRLHGGGTRAFYWKKRSGNGNVEKDRDVT